MAGPDEYPAVSTKVENLEDAMARLKEIYRDDYLADSVLGVEGNLPDLIAFYDNRKLYEQLHFSEWFALYDYGKNGYVRINKELLEPPVNAEVRGSINHLELSVRHLADHQASIFSEISDMLPFYRGEVRAFWDINRLREGDVYASPAFFSTTEEMDVAESFISSEMDALGADKVNVIYTVKDISPYSGASLSDVMSDGETEFLFLPNVRFAIEKIEYRAEEKLFEIDLVQIPISRQEFSVRLTDLVREGALL